LFELAEFRSFGVGEKQKQMLELLDAAGIYHRVEMSGEHPFIYHLPEDTAQVRGIAREWLQRSEPEHTRSWEHWELLIVDFPEKKTFF
jgi:hypothetical protein